MANANKYCPDIAIPPGETLLEVIESLELTQAELAERMGRPKKTINEIIKGKAAITPETAIQLERVVNVPASFWNNLELNYREDLARIKESERLEHNKTWLKAFPVRKMVAYGWIPEIKDKVMLADKLLSYFGVASVKAWERKWNWDVCLSFDYRKSEKFRMELAPLAVWIRQGELEAAKVEVNKFDIHKFSASMVQLRELTLKSPDQFIPIMQKICAECGVAVVFIPELEKVPVNGVTKWASSDKAIIQLSLRYKTDDHFWFSFFHEAGHVIKHGKRDFLYSEVDEEAKKTWEEEANKFALDVLISNDAYRYFVSKQVFNSNSVKQFAASQNISPGIVAGRLQHDGEIPHSCLNDLKRKFQWC